MCVTESRGCSPETLQVKYTSIKKKYIYIYIYKRVTKEYHSGNSKGFRSSVSAIRDKDQIYPIGVPYVSAIPLQGLYPREMKTCVHPNIYTNLHGSIIPNSWKMKTIQNIHQWMNECEHLYERNKKRTKY